MLGAAYDAAPPSAPPDAQSQQDLPEIPADLVDPAFEGKVDLARIRQALGSLDAGTLVAEAAKLVQAERSLGKRHWTLSAPTLFEVAMRAIGEKHDKEAFDCLERTLAELGIRDFDERLAATRKLLASPRRVSAKEGAPLLDSGVATEPEAAEILAPEGESAMPVLPDTSEPPPDDNNGS